jgi:phosphotransferase family enzyme
MAGHREGHSLPGAVLALLGADIVDHSGAGACRVVSGGGLVAKVGPPDIVAREASVLATPLPLAVPLLVDAGPGWLVMTAEDDDGSPWDGPDLHAALSDLARLHDSFQSAALEDAGAFLRRPFSPEGVEALLAPARRLAFPLPPALAGLLDDPAPIVAAAEAEPATVLHGDPWPPNILRPGPGRRVWVDWELASLGPAAADVASWLGQTPWHTGMPADGHLAAYLTARSLPVDRPRFERALDAATVLWFLAYDVPRLAAGRRSPGPAASPEPVMMLPLVAAGRLVAPTG